MHRGKKPLATVSGSGQGQHTMKAMLIRRYGGPEVLEPGEVATPRPGHDDVLVRVHGSSVNPVDCGMRAGMLPFVPLHMPAVLGVDVTGEVVETGDGAPRFSAGDRVFAYTGLERPGGYGEYAVLAESSLARVPVSLSWAEAGTVPGVGATAYEALTVHAPLRPGMHVFVNGGAGGVGTYAIQVAKALGAQVTVTASGGKAGFLRELGADHVIDYTTRDPYTPAEEGYDVLLNAVRGAPLSRLGGLLGPDGVLVTLTGAPAERGQVLASGRRTAAMVVTTSGQILDGLATLIDGGQVRPVVEHTYTWDRLAEAHRRVETGRVTGKIAIVPPESPDIA